MEKPWTLGLVVVLAAGCAVENIRHGWMMQATARYCDAPEIEGYETYGGGVGPATFVWRARCPDGRGLRCSGTPESQERRVNLPHGPAHTTSTYMVGECQDLSPTAPEPQGVAPLTPNEVLSVLQSVEAEARACIGLNGPPEVSIRFQVNGDGSAIYLGTEPAAPPEAASCLRRLFHGLRFRATGSPPLQLNSPPLIFEQPPEPPSFPEPPVLDEGGSETSTAP